MPRDRNYRRRRSPSSSDSGSSDNERSRKKAKTTDRRRSKSRERYRGARSRSRENRDRYRRDQRGRGRSSSRSPSRGNHKHKERERNKRDPRDRPGRSNERTAKSKSPPDDSNRQETNSTPKADSIKTEESTTEVEVSTGWTEKDFKHPATLGKIKMNTESASESNNQQSVLHVNNGDTSQPTSQAQDGTNSEEVVHETTVEELKAETKRIEEEMNKRRERLAAWRAARQKEEEEAQAKMEEEKKTRKEWSLENDDDDDEDDEANKMEETTDAMDSSQDVDPLDAFMTEVKQEVIKVNETFKKKYTAAATGSSKKSQNMVDDEMIQELKAVPPNENKEEVLQNDQDALEYSDEEENPDAELASALSTIFKKTKKKDLPKVDHKKINYEPFRKDFYVEVPDLARLTPEEVSAYRIELENIKIKGKDCPKPVKTWAQCGLHSRVLEVLKKNSYLKPTPIQAQAIPAIMSGRDLIGIAKTGSGKTLAFLLPLFRHVMDQNPLGPEDGPIALIFTPTRELAIQIYNETKKFCKVLKLKPVCVYGGTGVSEQIADLKRGAEIVICTPGRMIDVLAANSGRVTNLRRLTYLVLDEADRMFDMGFEPQVMRIISNSRPDRQTVMFSATFPRQMEALARKILTLPVEVQVGGRSVVCKDVEQTVVVLEENQKFFKLLELLGIYQEEGSVLVFVERQEIADGLIKDLMKASYPCLALHGGMDQSDRDSVISDFKNNSISLLVATSVAARGLDVRHLILVVNYDCPNHYEDYVHRCGRTGRAGRKGYACTLVTVNQGKYSGEIIKALELSGANVPEELSELWKNYTEQTKADGTAKVKKRASGFKGKGFKFNEEENAKSLEKKLKQKSSLNLNDSDDEDEYAILTMEKKLEEVFSGKPRKIDPAAPQINIIKNTQVHLNATASKNLAKAAAIADKIAASKNLGMNNSSISATQEAASNVLKGEEVNMSGAVLASQIAASINAKVGASRAKASKAYLPVGTVLPAKPTQDNNDDSDEDDLVPKRDMSQLIHFEDDIDINDFPQSIRFRITTRDVLDDIGDLADAYISVRGIYIPPGKQLKANEVRLHLLIEAKTERSVTLAKQEIKHVVKEEAQKLAARVNPYQVSGRYSVL